MTGLPATHRTGIATAASNRLPDRRLASCPPAACTRAVGLARPRPLPAACSFPLPSGLTDPSLVPLLLTVSATESPDNVARIKQDVAAL